MGINKPKTRAVAPPKIVKFCVTCSKGLAGMEHRVGGNCRGHRANGHIMTKLRRRGRWLFLERRLTNMEIVQCYVEENQCDCPRKNGPLE
jgi:hypothetical protein